MFILIAGIIGLSALTQSVTGFGLAIVGMPLLHFTALPPAYAAPLIALVAIFMRPLMLWHYWQWFRLRDMWKMGLASVLGIPLGVFALDSLDERVVSMVLGVVIVLYAAYSLYREATITQERARISERWSWGLGFVAGLLGGAYNIFGPPAVVYANGRGWQSNEFKANLQAFALLNSVFITLAHTAKGNFTPEVLALALIGVPFAMLGLVVGYWLNTIINQQQFTRIVIVMMFVMGFGLIL